MRKFIFCLIFAIILFGCSNSELLNVNTSDNAIEDIQIENEAFEYAETERLIGLSTLFRDGWNLDAALDSRPIGTLVVTIKTSDKYLAGTDCDIYFGMKLSNGRVYERLLDKEGYNDFERNDLDDYFLYVGDKTFYPNQVASIWLRSVKSGAGPDWHVNYIKVRINGVLVYTKNIKAWIDPGQKYTMNSVNFPAAQDIPISITN